MIYMRGMLHSFTTRVCKVEFRGNRTKFGKSNVTLYKKSLSVPNRIVRCGTYTCATYATSVTSLNMMITQL